MNKKIKIVADNKIPFLSGVLDPFAEVTYLAPGQITKENIYNADALIIRTRTKCNAQLLEGTSVKFIATATIGFDHIDQNYCAEKNIMWTSAPGCNSSSVMQYIASALVRLAEEYSFNFSEKTIGIIGIGNVGVKIKRLSEVLGMRVLCNDPPRERAEGNLGFATFEEITKVCDIISFHVPLNRAGTDKTYHMAGEEFFRKIKNAIIINASRGEVIKTTELKDAIKNKTTEAAVLDVWENEPEIDNELLELTDIATPHIAGYSANGKANGTSICVKAISDFFKLDIDKNWYPDLPQPAKNTEFELDCRGKSQQQILSEAILYTYDIFKDDKKLKSSPETFEEQRGKYPVRLEFTNYKIKLLNSDLEIENKLNQLGFCLYNK